MITPIQHYTLHMAIEIIGRDISNLSKSYLLSFFNLFSVYNTNFKTTNHFVLPIICRVCGGCKREIGQGNYLGCIGTFFHPQCFRCRACNCPITEHEVGLLIFDFFHLQDYLFYQILIYFFSIEVLFVRK